MTADEPSVCDFTVKLNVKDYKFNEFTTNYEIVLSLRSEDCILQFPSKVFDAEELSPAFEIPMLMPFARLFDKMAVEISEITLCGEAEFMESKLDQVDFPNDHPYFSALNIGLELEREYSGELVQFMSLQNAELLVGADMPYGELWLEFETQYFSVRSRYKKGVPLRNLFLPDTRDFIIKLQHRFATSSQEEFVTLWLINCEKSYSTQRGHSVVIRISDFIDEKLFQVGNLLVQSDESVPCAFLSEMFHMQDYNFDEFLHSLKYEPRSEPKEPNFKSTLSFVLGVGMPVASKKMEFVSMSAYAEKARGDAGCLLLVGVEGDFDFACISVQGFDVSHSITQNISLQGQQVYSVKLEKPAADVHRIIAPLLGGDYYNSFPSPLAQADFSLTQLLNETSALHISVFAGASCQVIDVDLPNLQNEIVSSCEQQKDYTIQYAKLRVVLGASQRGIIRKSSSALLSSRFKNHSVETGIFGSHSYSSITNYSSTTNSAECENCEFELSVDFSSFDFHSQATHYATKLELTFSNYIIELCQVLKEVHEKKVQLMSFLPVQFQEQDFSFDLNIVQFDGDAFTLLSDETFMSQFELSKQTIERTFQRRVNAIPYKLFTEVSSKPFKLLYINFEKLENSFADLFEQSLAIELFCEVQTAGCLERRCIIDEKLNFVFPYTQEIKEVLVKIGFFVQLLGYFEAVPFCTLCIKLQERQALNGVSVQASVSDLVSQKAVHEFAQATRSPESFLAGRAVDQIPPDYFRQLFGIPQLDNNDVAVTPAIKTAQKGEIRVKTTCHAFIKLSYPSTFQQNQYLNYTDYISQIQTPDPCYVVSCCAPYSWVRVGATERDMGNQLLFEASDKFNYTMVVDSKSSTIVTYQADAEIMANIWSPLVIQEQLFGGCFVTVTSETQQASAFYNFEQYKEQAARSTQDKLDFQVPGAIKGLILSQTGTLTKVNLSALIETIDNDSEDEDANPHPFTEVHEKPTFISNDFLLIQNMRRYTRVQREQQAYEPLKTPEINLEELDPQDIDRQLKLHAPNYEKRRDAELKAPGEPLPEIATVKRPPVKKQAGKAGTQRPPAKLSALPEQVQHLKDVQSSPKKILRADLRPEKRGTLKTLKK